MNLIELVRQYRRGIFVALALVAIENLAWIVEPTLFGNVIDAMIDAAAGEPKASAILPLLLWIGAFATNSGVGAIRRSVDQMIYLRMFTEIATNVSRSAVKHRMSVSRTAARAQLSREYITFFQYRVPEIGEQSISIGGALIGLAIFDLRIAGACSVVIVPLVLINAWYTRRVAVLQASLHDSYEETFEVFSTKNPDKVRTYFLSQNRAQQHIANYGAISFGLMRFVLLLIFLVVLYIAIDLDNFSTGNIYSIVAYLWTFITSSEYIPELLESWTSLKDISRRLKSDTV
jgi:ABC-type multidrug transport system fused ATPase/permease subunit